MKGYLLLACGLLGAVIAQAQTEQQAIQQWQNAHPKTHFISAERFASLSKEEKTLLGSDIIIYEGTITMAQIEAQRPETKSALAGENEVLREQDAVLIKNWKAANPDVKVIPRSVYDAIEGDQQSAYSENPRCLILEGEYLTVKDIERFEH